MSSMRNAVQRRNHKERAQPLERQKWGLLEKHKDYSLRAKDHNEKKRRLKVLREKAAQRNPDEFAFGMITRTTKKGVQQSTRGKDNGSQAPMNMDIVKLLKTQDAGYLQTVLQQTRRAREKIEKQAVLMTTGVDASSISKRKVFDDNGELIEETKRQPAFDNDDDMDLDLDDLADLGDLDGLDDLDGIDGDGSGSEGGKSEGEESDTEGLSKEEIRQRRKKRRAQEVLQNHLEALKDRERDLSVALSQLQHQRARMNNTVGGVNKEGVKFKVRERKR
ncbi:U3 small nucleolar RNA-associated protein 11 [Aureobasidium sp. EXF-12298]|nr:U3 small nucleolar RNA-associated protein 11 [Aureobasidium sp. EXF-12298]KAI4762114.1 U3 small nucleolar RNA-associated protein 11 [Aureobasidium sp. EXF-12344]KAI4779409.1 U3 small nucleolar RNA-associated protein 11 [Aureobasidium sp. EXF-3400]